VLTVRETVLSLDDPRLADVLEDLSSLLRASGRTREAEPMEARARAIRSKHR
jgi:hypothetical protein